MNRKMLIKYLLMYVPFIIGVLLFGMGIVNIISSLLLIVGGYIAIKNTFDYRLVRRHMKKLNLDNIKGVKGDNIVKSNNVNSNLKQQVKSKSMDNNESIRVKTRIRKK